MLFAGNPAEVSTSRVVITMGALWLAGVAMRMTILAMPPVIPLVHAELHMTETQVGLLVGLPLLMFALAAIPGSLLIARIGVMLAVICGMVIAALAGAARGAAPDVPTLYVASIVTGFGVAIMQPGLPTLAREWAPSRIGLATVAYTSGMMMGATFPPLLGPYVLPLVGGSWRLDLVLWAVPALLIVPVFWLMSPPRSSLAGSKATSQLWWPDFKSPVVWLLGLTFGSNNSPYFAINAFLGDYVAQQGRPDLLAPSLAWLNGSQIAALVVLFALAGRLQRRIWPFLLFGPILLAGNLAMILVPTGFVIVTAAAFIGVATAMTFTPIMTLPPILSTPADLPRTAAGMLTIAYGCAIIVPTVCGALWDLTGRPWTVFLPLCLCALALTVLGTLVTKYRPAGET
ncbi:MAG TPA: MFS transporter [Xanthobacteraceae bacterium]|jgi:CP family cyanate transporter-like MFS transporter|nr:MFS transporter [Xanthobacteraceae bacterium]